MEVIDWCPHDPNLCLLQTQGANYLTNPKCSLGRLRETLWANLGRSITVLGIGAAAAAAAKSLQSCLTLCNPRDGSPPGSPVPGPWDSPGKNTGVGFHFLLQCMEVKSESEVAQSSLTLRPRGLQPTRLLRPWDFPG